jgi:lysozyme family protein
MSKAKKTPPKFADISGEYWSLFLDCKVRQEKLSDVKQIVTKITNNRKRYETVTATLGTMPWWFVAVIHAMESSLSFSRHLHNGDPLTARTFQVPAGRPAANPGNSKEGPSAKNPYTWEESAQDALRLKNLQSWTDWTIRASLFKMEEYNGWGYRLYHPDVLTPYLWSYTDKYTSGKYASDGNWNAKLVSAQAGAAAILRVMVDTGLVFPIDYVGDFPTSSSTVAYA